MIRSNFQNKVDNKNVAAVNSLDKKQRLSGDYWRNNIYNANTIMWEILNLNSVISWDSVNI